MSTEAIWNRRYCYGCCCCRCRLCVGSAIVCSFFKFIYTQYAKWWRWRRRRRQRKRYGSIVICAYRRRHIKHLKIYDVHKQTASSNKRWFTLCKSFWRLVFEIAYTRWTNTWMFWMCVGRMGKELWDMRRNKKRTDDADDEVDDSNARVLLIQLPCASGASNVKTNEKRRERERRKKWRKSKSSAIPRDIEKLRQTLIAFHNDFCTISSSQSFN